MDSTVAGWPSWGQHAKGRQPCTALQWQHQGPVCTVGHSRCFAAHVAKIASPERRCLRHRGRVYEQLTSLGMWQCLLQEHVQGGGLIWEAQDQNLEHHTLSMAL